MSNGKIIPNDKYSLKGTIKSLKSFNFPFIFCYSEEEEYALREQANRIKESAENYLKFLDYLNTRPTNPPTKQF